MRTSIWLLPDEETAAPLGEAIAEIAQALGAPSFIPHLTVLGEATASGPALALGLEALSCRAPLVLRAESLELSEVYHRALFLRVRTEPALLRLREAALGGLGTHGGAPWIPHVSLLSADLPADEKRPWIARLASTLPRRLRFTRLCAAYTTGPVGGWHIRWQGPLVQPS